MFKYYGQISRQQKSENVQLYELKQANEQINGYTQE
jgi:hypothetical protein